MDPLSIFYTNNDLKWVDAPIPALVLFYISIFPVITNHNLNNQPANTLFSLFKNLNQGFSKLLKS